MAGKGYSIRFTRNYYRNPQTGKWCGHSVGVWDQNGYTRKWPTLEEAKEYAEQRIAANRKDHGENDENFVKWAKIYCGKDCVLTIS